MTTGPDTLHVVLAALAVWRLTHLLAREDGPGDVVFRVRRALGDSVLGRALDCFYCLSMWVALPFAALLARSFGEGVMLWLALSVPELFAATPPGAALPGAAPPASVRTAPPPVAASPVAAPPASAIRAPQPIPTPAQLWQRECGDCHIAFPARLLPAASWRALMQGLDRHFGVDATLDAPAAAAIARYLEQNAGPDRSVATRTPPLRITELAWFQREHREVPASLWKDPAVGRASNCAACHQDAASGRFRESALRLPGRAGRGARGGMGAGRELEHEHEHERERDDE